MASLATGSVNFPTIVYENPPDFVDGLAKTMLDNGIKPRSRSSTCAMLYSARRSGEEGLIGEPPHVQFVMGVKNAMPARRANLRIPASPSCASVLPGRHLDRRRHRPAPVEVNSGPGAAAAIAAPASRTTCASDKDTLAASNAELVGRVADALRRVRPPVATPAEARQMLGLRAA